MSDIQRLRDEHAQLIEVIGQLGAAVQQATPPPAVELFELRAKLARALIGHLKSEDWLLYPRLLESKDPNVAETARLFVEKMGGLAAAFTDYSRQWSAKAIETDWQAYCQATTEIVTALRTRIEREDRELYPLIEAVAKAA